MRIVFHLPFTIIRTNYLKDIEAAKEDFLRTVRKESESFETAVRKAVHGAYAGIVCASCGKNVFRGENNDTWVHGNGGKAYCLNPCWKNLHKK